MDLMKASIAHGIRPSALVLGKDSKKPWGPWDIVLAKAYQRFLNELCPQCGMPKYLCHTDDNRIQFRLIRDECASTAISERELKKMADDTDHKSYGVRLFAEPYLVDDETTEGLELSDFRRPYLFDKAKKQGLIPDDVPTPAP